MEAAGPDRERLEHGGGVRIGGLLVTGDGFAQPASHAELVCARINP